MRLNELPVGQSAKIVSVGGEGALRQHFLDMGLIPNAVISLTKLAPMGDPMELRVQGYELTLRLADAADVVVEPCEASEIIVENQKQQRYKPIEHPGLGEDGKYHVKATEHPLPDDTLLTFALVGNQNSGKTTLFNQLTGANQHVGNFPGVTVDKISGPIRGHQNTEVTDLPGIYSLSPYTSEEIVSRDYILKEKPTAIINIVDAGNIERNLYLTLQLLELDIPMVLALNMMDEVTANGGTIRVNEMEDLLGIPVVPISAAKNEGVDELIRHAVHVAHYQEKPGRNDFCGKGEKGGAVHRCIHSVMQLFEDHAQANHLPERFAASKLAEGDPLIFAAMKLDQNEQETLEHIVLQMEEESGLDRNAAIADMRFHFIRKLCQQTVTHPQESKEHARSRKIDRVLTGKWTALPIFILAMAAIFYLTFGLIGPLLQHWIALGVSALANWAQGAMQSGGVGDIVQSLVLDGIFAGVGSVVSFLPNIVVLFFFLSLLEDTGYMARVAFVMDKLLRKIGLSGKSIVPMLIGFGCTVPAVMSARTLSSARDRKITILLTPFMSCSAKMPIYAFFSSAFFPQHAALVMLGLYLLGILVGIAVALIAKVTAAKGEAIPFMIELPNYRLPSLKNVALLLWDKTKDFLKRAFTVILIASVVVWLLQSFDFNFHLAVDSSESILACLSGWVAPIFIPMGLGAWQIVTSLICGFMAKESVVSTLSVLLGTTALSAFITPQAAIALLIFSLLYTPCVASIATIRHELGRRWAAVVLVGQCVLAWVLAYAGYLAAGLFR